MPLYAYRCAACGHEREHLQKLNDAPLTQCPKCGAAKYTKQLTAAGFQLKGTGWYATDFKGGNSKKSEPAPQEAAASKEPSKPSETSSSAKESTSTGNDKSVGK